MALASVHGLVLSGVSGQLVRVEVDVAQGLPTVGVVGLPDASVGESRWRARSALASIGAAWPNRRVTISLSPAEVRKVGAGLDLPIAVAVLKASDQLPDVDLGDIAFVGELGLDGQVRPARGALACALAARRAGIGRIVVAPSCAREVALLTGLGVVPAGHLATVVAVLREGSDGDPLPAQQDPDEAAASTADLRDVRGHLHARFALEVAAAGQHHLAMVGPPGVGKTLLAERLPGLLPDLEGEAVVEVAAIHSVAAVPRPAGTQARPPYRAPHHSASSAALLGTVHGYRVSPGAVTLAHRGVLFMDEAPEFSRPSLEGLRQPLESGVVSINRSGWSGVLPGRFQLVLAANPCPCGLRSGTGEGCSCTPVAVRRYASRLSGPFMDRIDVRLSLQRPAAAELAGGDADSSAVVRARVAAARRRASERFAGRSWQTNAGIPAGELRREWLPDAGGIELLNSLERGSANLRGPDRVLRLAWTLADLAGRPRPGRDDVAAAMSLRGASTTWAA